MGEAASMETTRAALRVERVLWLLRDVVLIVLLLAAIKILYVMFSANRETTR